MPRPLRVIMPTTKRRVSATFIRVDTKAFLSKMTNIFTRFVGRWKEML